MAFKGMRYTPDKDAGWGLIYRLNNLWVKADEKCLGADMDGWNFVLDKIYSNLLYKDEMNVSRDEKTKKIIMIKIDEEKQEEFEWFATEIKRINNEMSERARAYNKDKKIEDLREHNKLKQKKYLTILCKEIWLRKYMFFLGLYLKTVDKGDPSQAMWRQ